MRQGGFTLVEVLVVLVIMGLLTVVATLSLGGVVERNMDEEVERLQRVLELTAERASVRGTPIAVDFTPGSYRFSVLEASGKWRLLFSPASLAEHGWKDGLRVAALSIADVEQKEPYRLVFTSHESPEFVLRLSTPQGSRILEGRLSGSVDLRTPPAQALAPQ